MDRCAPAGGAIDAGARRHRRIYRWLRWWTRVWVRQGKLGEALGWVRERGLSVDDNLSYLSEFEHITLARMLLAKYAAEGALRFLDEATGFL